jgi:RNA polymerase sigma factor (sigma-70 family)
VYPEQSNLQSDYELVKKIIDGDRHASILLIRNTERLVAQIVYKMIRNRSERNDLMQDIYLKVFKNLPTFQFRCKLSTWIAQISYTTCLDNLKKFKTEPLESFTDEDSGFDRTWMKLADEGLDVSQLLAGKERAAILDQLSAKLPPVYHTLVTLFHKEELGIEEIAEITNLPNGTVKNYLFRARKLLKENLLRHYKKEDI